MFSYSRLIATNNLVLCLARVGRWLARSTNVCSSCFSADLIWIRVSGPSVRKGSRGEGERVEAPPCQVGPSSLARIRDTKPVSGRRKLEFRSALQDERRVTWTVTMRQILRTHIDKSYPTRGINTRPTAAAVSPSCSSSSKLPVTKPTSHMNLTIVCFCPPAWVCGRLLV